MSKKSKLIAAAAIAVLSLSSQAFARGGMGGGFGGGHMGGGHMASGFHSFSSSPLTSFHTQSPTLNPSESYTLPESPEAPVSPNG